MQDFDAILFGELGEDFLAEVFVFLGPTYVAKFFKAGTSFAASQASAKVVKDISQISTQIVPEVHPKFMRPWEHSTVKSSACWVLPGLAECTIRWGRMTCWVCWVSIANQRSVSPPAPFVYPSRCLGAMICLELPLYL